MNNEEELVYWSGFLEADGCIIMTKRIRNGRPCYVMQVNIGQKNRKVCEDAQKFFDVGTIQRNSCNANFYNWNVSSNQAYEVLKRIYPFLRYKKEQAKLCMEYREKITRYDHPNKGHGCLPVPKEEIELRESYYKKVRELNGKRND
jgi:hypothetical protein